MFITADRHVDQRWVPTDARMQAARERTVSLVMADVRALAERLPIVIPTTPGALPQALITPAATNTPFGEHIPQLWQDYPFSLIPGSLGVDANGEPTTHDMLWMDPLASQPTHPMDGYCLFDQNGQPSEALQGVMARLRKLKEEIDKTHAVVKLLHEAKALKIRQLTHLGQSLQVYEIIPDGLGDWLDQRGHPDTYGAVLLAEALERSQQDLVFDDPAPQR